MSIHKSKRQDILHHYVLTGREHISLRCFLPGGEIVSISIQQGSVDVNGREYVAVDVTFNPEAKLEFDRAIPQNAKLLLRMPKESDEIKKAA